MSNQAAAAGEPLAGESDGLPSIVAPTDDNGPEPRPTSDRAWQGLAPSHAPLAPPLAAGQDEADRFAYELALELEPSGSVAAYGEWATIDCRFRHFHHSPIELRPGASGQFNLGFRVVDTDSGAVLFEDRMYPDPDSNPIAPERWVHGRLQVPRRAIRFDYPVELVADMLKEDEFWFASSPEHANRFRINFVEAGAVAAALRESGGNGQDLQLRHSPAPAFADPAAALAQRPRVLADTKVRHQLVFDVSDLVQYFQDSRLPTGIQRVQIEIIGNLIQSIPGDYSLKLACFKSGAEFWTELPPLFFDRICKLALLSGDTDAPEWRRALEELKARTDEASPLAFDKGAFLINLGTSWWLQNYFLNVRSAKARYGVRYVPFVHDLIPIVTPEHCVPELTRDFISWATGVLHHADHVMVNSRATAADVLRVARYLGHAIAEPAVVRLDAGHGRSGKTQPRLPHANQLFIENDLRAGEYVLLVATVEARKNHNLAFSAWLGLAKKHGASQVPKLVCVGKKGWLSDAVYRKLATSSLLQSKVLILSMVPDSDLECLYENCLFTLFPSYYEGWGLPVTESLCYGKVPVVSNSSSLPEAGGDFAEYFDLGSETELVQKLERLIFDGEYRQAREAHIAAQFRPRSWAEIGASVLDLVREWSADQAPANRPPPVASGRGLWLFDAEPGRYYALTQNTELRIWPGMVSAEMFRQGHGWWSPEPWGIWAKPPAARLAFFAPFQEGASVMLFLGLRGAPAIHSTVIARVSGVGSREVRLDPGKDQWLVFRIGADRLGALRAQHEHPLFDILLSADGKLDLREITDGADSRIVSLGVRGFMVCSEDDVRSRLRFLEAASLHDLASLEDKPIDTEYLLA